MNNRILLNKTDKVIEIVSAICLLALWVFVATSYCKLPQTIPIHYNALGEADGFGSRTMIIMLPLIATIIFAGMKTLSYYPHIFKYFTKSTHGDFNKRDKNTMLTIRCITLAVIVILGTVCIDTINTSLTQSYAKFGTWSLSFVFVIIISLLVYFFINSRTRQ